MAGLLAGSPPALSLDIKATKDTPLGQNLAKALPDLMKQGVGLYKGLDGNTGVLFNQRAIHTDDIKAADKAGKLLEVAPPIESLSPPPSDAGASVAAPAPPSTTTPTPPQTNTGMVQPAPVSKALKTARVNATKPGSPTSGPRPGAGRLQNMVMQPVV